MSFESEMRIHEDIQPDVEDLQKEIARLELLLKEQHTRHQKELGDIARKLMGG